MSPCVFSVFMVSSLVVPSWNSLCIFVTLSCEGSPRAVATVLGCLCELFSKWKPVTRLHPKQAPRLPAAFVFTGDRAMATMLCWCVKHIRETFQVRDMKKQRPFWASLQDTEHKRKISTPQGHHKHPPLPRSKQLASHGYHSNSDYTHPAVTRLVGHKRQLRVWKSCQHPRWWERLISSAKCPAALRKGLFAVFWTRASS